MISNAYANKILNMLTGVKDEIVMPQYVYLGLSETEPSKSTGTVTGEPTVNSYERKIVGGSSGTKHFIDDNNNCASGGIITNKKEIQLKTAREAYGKKMNYWFLSDSKTGAANIWGTINEVDGVINGIEVGANTVPTFYEYELKASIDVELT